MPSIYAGLHLPNKPDEFITLDQIDFDDRTVLNLKKIIAEKCKYDAENLELIYDGLPLSDEEKLCETSLKPEATIHCFQKTKKFIPYVPSKELKDSDVEAAQALFVTIGNIQINVTCRVNILQKVLAEYPEFRRNSAALALIRDSVLFNTLHQPEVIKKIAEHYPIILEAAPFIVSTVRKELARSTSSKFSEPATDSTNSSEEENSVGSNERGSRDEESGRTQSENARIRMISRQQLQAALAQIGFGSANSLSNIAQRNTETSVAASASDNTSTPLSSSSGERISSDVFRNELQRVLDSMGQRSSGSSGGGATGPQDPMAMDTLEQHSANTSMTDDGDIPVSFRTHEYAEQLRTMQQMGFLNHEENLNYLNLASGNIEQAVNLLMAAMM